MEPKMSPNIMAYYELLNDMNLFFRNIGDDDLSKKLDALGLSMDRKKILNDVLLCRTELDTFKKIDIQLYVLKIIFPGIYESKKINEHLYSNNELYKYDPPKNGQNIVKHGISFGEVVSFSNRFGTLSVPCPDKNDEMRVVIFSDLDIGENGKNLSLPVNSFANEREVYTLSVVQQLDLKFRFISSRVMSRKKFSKNMKNAFKNIYIDEPEKKKEFIARCVEILKRDLFRK